MVWLGLERPGCLLHRHAWPARSLAPVRVPWHALAPAWRVQVALKRVPVAGEAGEGAEPIQVLVLREGVEERPFGVGYLTQVENDWIRRWADCCGRDKGHYALCVRGGHVRATATAAPSLSVSWMAFLLRRGRACASLGIPETQPMMTLAKDRAGRGSARFHGRV